MINIKKSEIVISMSWIFSIIVGGFLLIFAYNILNTFYEIQDEKFSYQLTKNLEKVIEQNSITQGFEESSFTKIDLFKDTYFKINCFEGISYPIVNDYVVTETNFYNENPFFMTVVDENKVQNTKVITQKFVLLDKVVNLVSVYSSKNLILFHSGSKRKKEFIKNFENSDYRNLNFDEKDLTAQDFDDLKNNILSGTNYKSLVIVLDYDQNQDINDFKDFFDLNEEIYIVRFDKKNQKIYHSFFDKEKQEIIEKSFSYIDLDNSMSIQKMAILSSSQLFDCSYNKILEFTNLKLNFLYEKNQKYLEMLNRGKSLCSNNDKSSNLEKSLYESLESDIKSLKGEIKDYGFKNHGKIEDLVLDINNKNKNLNRNNCLLLY